MTVDWLGLILYVGGGGAFLIVAIALVRRGERRLGNWSKPQVTGSDDPGASAPESGRSDGVGADGVDPVSGYLDRMTGQLILPAADVDEVRAELADHVADSIASLEAEGMDHETAVREALGRLGPPAELGRQIRAAHQSTRRLLAGAGGGVFAAGGGFVVGYLGGFALAFGLILVIAALASVLTRVGVPLPDLSSPDASNITNSLFLGVILAFAAASAVRYAVRTSAGLSRRAPRSVAAFWVVAGVLVFGWLALFGLRGHQSWPGVAAELCIPIAAVAGGFARIERPMPHVGRWAAIAVAVGLILPLVLLAGMSVSGTPSAGVARQYQESDLHLDTVAPMAPAAWLPTNYTLADNGGTDYATGAENVDAHFVDYSDMSKVPSTPPIGPILANWRDVRFEAWHAIPMWQPTSAIGIDTRYASAIVIEPADRQGDSLRAVFHFERLRDAESWWIVATAVGPDGRRYRLGDGHGGDTAFNGSAWDWLTAPQ